MATKDEIHDLVIKDGDDKAVTNVMFDTMSIDKSTRVVCFESIGWADPDKKESLAKAVKWIEQLEFETHVYTDKEMKNEEKPPACKFIPTPKVMKSIVKVVSKHQH